MRKDQRKFDELRAVQVTPDFVTYPEGSVLIELGGTRVLCNVTIEDNVPHWMRSNEMSQGWVTAEYALLPRSTHTRTRRETKGLGGRTQEIKRLIGRSLRAAIDLTKLGERTCIIDCDVIQADGGTRTAAITGGYIALVLALKPLIASGELPESVLLAPIAAISVGILDGDSVLDLCYEEDSAADVDFNIVMNANKELIEVQGTAEGAAFTRDALDELLDLAEKGIWELFAFQQEILG